MEVVHLLGRMPGPVRHPLRDSAALAYAGTKIPIYNTFQNMMKHTYNPPKMEVYPIFTSELLCQSGTFTEKPIDDLNSNW